MLEITEIEQRLMADPYGILNFIKNSGCTKIVGKYYGMNTNGRIFGTLDELPKNFKNAILSNQGTYFQYEATENFGIDLSKVYAGLLVLESGTSGSIYLNGKSIYKWSAVNDSEYFMGIDRNDFRTDEELQEKKLESLRIIMKNIESLFNIYRE